MRAACEALRLMDDVTGVELASEAEADAARKKDGRSVGRLYRVAMEKKRVWGAKGGFPIEYARLQTDYPSREGWNHGWTR
jgi:large subunit ribosomal protein L40